MIGLMAAPLGLLVGYVLRRLTCHFIANFFAPHPVRWRAGEAPACAQLTAAVRRASSA